MKDYTNEIWRDVVGAEGLYQVSNWGRVKSLNYNHTGQEQILKPMLMNNGYLTVHLCKNGKGKTVKVHRLVGMTFPDLVGWTEDAKGRPFEELEINHKREMEKTNNHVSNLEWCDHIYNINYGTGIERRSKANTNGKRSKRVAQKTLDGELVKIWSSLSEIHRQTGWGCSNISKCCLGKKSHKTAYNFLWEFID